MSSAPTCIKESGLYVACMDWNMGGYFGFNNQGFGSVEGLEDFIITIQEVEGKEHRSCNELTFYGGFYDYLKAKLIDDTTNPNLKDARVYFEIKDSCCKDSTGADSLVYWGWVFANAITYCDNVCSISANIIQKTTDMESEICLANTMIYDNSVNGLGGGFQDNVNHPKVEYCLDYKPRIVHNILVFLGLIIIIVLGVIQLISYIVSAIIVVVCAIVTCSDELKNGITDDVKELEDYISDWFIGCGRYHPAPYITDYVENVCKICGGLTFKSSIFTNQNSDYYRLAMLSASVDGGKAFKIGGVWDTSTGPSLNWMDKDRPIMSGKILLDNLAIVFNAKWQVLNNELLFERKDLLPGVTGSWLDMTLSNSPNVVGDGYCISWLDEDVPSYLNIGYQSELVEIEGQSRLENYRHIVEYNPNHNVYQKGERMVSFPFGASSYADGCDFFHFLRTGLVSAWTWLFGADATPENVLIMAQDTCFLDKLIILDPVSVITEGEVAYRAKWWQYSDITTNKILSPSFTRQNPQQLLDMCSDGVSSGGKVFNYPMMVNPNYSGNLYDFHRIDEPWNTTYKQKSIEFTIEANCDNIQAATIKKGVVTKYGTMEVTSIEIKYKNKLMTIKGKI